jgi:hypothetical protein
MSDSGDATTKAAPDPSREDMTAPSVQGDVSVLCGRELLRAHYRLVMAGVPLPVEEHLAEVDAGADDGSGG